MVFFRFTTHHSFKSTLMYHVQYCHNGFHDTAIATTTTATKQGHKGAAEQLLKCGANINATSSRQATALFMSAYYGHADVTLMLLAWGKWGSVTGKCRVVENLRTNRSLPRAHRRASQHGRRSCLCYQERFDQARNDPRCSYDASHSALHWGGVISPLTSI